MTDVVERFERHAARERPVADHRHDRLVTADDVASARKSDRDRDGRGRVAGVVDVVGALGTLGESAEAAVRSQRAELGAPAGDQFVYVGLVADVSDDLVLGTVERAMQTECELDRAEIRRQMAAGVSDGVDERLPYLPRELR